MNLRDKALDKLKQKKSDHKYTQDDLKEIIYELEVHQIELEIQNHELLQKEEELIKSQEELNILFRDAPIGYIVLDDKHLIKKFNNKALEIFGSAINRKSAYLYTTFKDLSFMQDFLEWTENKKQKDTYKVLIVTEYYQEKWVELSHVESNFNGKNIHLISIQDVTKELDQKSKLYMYGFILDQLPVSVIITDSEGNMVFVNKSLLKHSKYSNDELIGMKPSVFKTDYTSQEEYEILWETIKQGKTWSGVFKNKTKKNNVHWMATTISPIFDMSGEISHYISIESNIDEKVKMEEALQKQEEIMLVQSRHAAMGEMLSMIAHQWRQPLSIISTISSSINLKNEFNMLDVKRDLKDINKITEVTKYLSETINDFRNFFKNDKEIKEIRLKDILDKILNISDQVLKNNNIDVSIEDNSNDRVLKTYSNELFQAILNIMNNAKDVLIEKSRSEDRKIFIEILDEEAGQIININDNGGGVDVSILHKIFEPYFTTKDKRSGTGLGLYITRTIIEKHLKGIIKVSNNDKGAVFSIYLPLDIEE